jgi:hypothetical protein
MKVARHLRRAKLRDDGRDVATIAPIALLAAPQQRTLHNVQPKPAPNANAAKRKAIHTGALFGGGCHPGSLMVMLQLF